VRPANSATPPGQSHSCQVEKPPTQRPHPGGVGSGHDQAEQDQDEPAQHQTKKRPPSRRSGVAHTPGCPLRQRQREASSDGWQRNRGGQGGMDPQIEDVDGKQQELEHLRGRDVRSGQHQPAPHEKQGKPMGRGAHHAYRQAGASQRKQRPICPLRQASPPVHERDQGQDGQEKGCATGQPPRSTRRSGLPDANNVPGARGVEQENQAAVAK